MQVAILKLLAIRSKTDRICAAEMHEMIKTHGESTSLTPGELGTFLDRAAFRKYELLRPAHQATAQSARTLLYTETGDAAEDSITVHEFSAFVMRYVADAIEESTAMAAGPGVVQKFKDNVAVLDREQHIGGSGGSLEPLDLFLCTFTPRIWSILEHPECMPALLNPLAERTCFSQVLDSVDGAMMEKAGRLARTKELFRTTDGPRRLGAVMRPLRFPM
jgi:hypothetical protein